MIGDQVHCPCIKDVLTFNVLTKKSCCTAAISQQQDSKSIFGCLQTRESRNVAYVAMTRAERVLYLSHVGSITDANSFFTEAMLPGDIVTEI